MAELTDDLDRYPIAESGDLVDQVPVIDVAAVVENAASEEARAGVDAIARACREWGFFQVVNHGVPQSLIDATWRETRRFSPNPPVSRTRSCVPGTTRGATTTTN